MPVRPFVDSKKKYLHSTCERYVSILFFSLPPGPDELVNRRLMEWVKSMKERFWMVKSCACVLTSPICGVAVRRKLWNYRIRALCRILHDLLAPVTKIGRKHVENLILVTNLHKFLPAVDIARDR